MPIPQFIVDLRAKIGTDPLWLSGVTGVVINDRDEVLLTKRADTGNWHLISGILEPGEQPAHGLLREISEETGVIAEVQRLSSTWAGPPTVVPSNGDQVQFLDLCFRCRYVSGEPVVGDDENVDVRWFSLDALPEMRPAQLERIEHARPVEGQPYFVT